jgi:AraC family transcriptional regulator, transcriptional activator of pobA
VKRREIPHYFLYGEDSQDVDERFLHVESIAERSRLHDWTIEPHAHRDLHHLLMVTRGGGVFHVEGATHNFGAPCMIAVPLASVHGFDFKPATDGWIVTGSGTLLGRIRRDHPELAAIVNDAAVIPLTLAGSGNIAALFDALAAEFRGNGPARRTAAESLLMVILVTALRQKLQLTFNTTPARSADSKLLSRYRSQLEENYRKPMSITEYAARLCVSQERLRLACVRTTGSSPLALLNARRLLEAKRSLLYTNMNIALIAESCGFQDPAYFSRFFARSTGKSPRAYRSRQ